MNICYGKLLKLPHFRGIQNLCNIGSYFVGGMAHLYGNSIVASDGMHKIEACLVCEVGITSTSEIFMS